MRPLFLTALLAFATTASAADATPGTTTASSGSVSAQERVSAPRDARGKQGKKNRNQTRRTKGKRGKKGKAVKIDSVSPFHGVFLYGPKLGTHDKYAKADNRRKPTRVKPKDLPDRKVRREGDLAVGLTAGSLIHGYADGTSYGDLGLGLKGRYRPIEFVGIELGVARHGSQLLGGERGQTLISGSGQLFAFPWATLQPYASAGFTLNQRADVAPRLGASSNLTGGHLGLGVEYSFSKNAAVDIEARGYRWLGQDATDLSNPGAVQLTGGLTMHF